MAKYINYLILQSNSEIDVLHEGRKLMVPEDLRQGMIKKRPAVLLCVSSIQIFIHLPIISSIFHFRTILSVLKPIIELSLLSAQGKGVAQMLMKSWQGQPKRQTTKEDRLYTICCKILLSMSWILSLSLKKNCFSLLEPLLKTLC